MRANIGCGPIQPAGWVNIDPDPRWDRAFGGPTLVTAPADPGWFHLVTAGHPVGYEGAVAHHVLQMVAWPELVPWLRDVHDVLAAGGWLRVSVPDFPGAYAAALEGDRDWFPIADDHEASIDGKLCLYLTQAGASRSIFTGPWLCDLLRRAGFLDVHETGPAQTSGPAWLSQLDNRPGESIYVEGRRP